MIELEELVKSHAIKGIADTKTAKEGDITFLSDKKFLDDLKTTKASFALVKESDKEFVPKGCKAIVVDDPYLAFAKLTQIFAPKPKIKSENIVIGYNSKVDDTAIIMSNVVIGNSVTIGKNVKIYPNVTIYDNTIIEDDVTIHSGTVIGSDGFGYAYEKDRTPVKIVHFGRVVIKKAAEIGANCTIDRGVFNDTIIGENCKIDNLVQIGHNCELEKNCIVVSQSGLAGSTKLKECVTMGAQSGTAGHLEIAPYTFIAARGGVTKSITKSGVYAGFPIKEHKTWLKEQAKIAKLAKEKNQ